MNRSEKRCIGRFKALVFLLDQEEVDAVLGAVPMTQELCDSILDKCAGHHVEEFFCETLSKYPEFLRESAKKIESELEEQPVSEGYYVVSPEDDELLWKKVYEEIKDM